MQINEKIERARVLAGLTQDQMAEKLGIKRSTYQYWEKKAPSVDKIRQIAGILNLAPDYFFGDNDEPFVNHLPYFRSEPVEKHPFDTAQYFTADQIFHIYMKAMERQDKLMEAQTVILNSIENKMARESTQAIINSKVDTVIASLADAKEVEEIASKHRQRQVEQILAMIEQAGLRKNVLSEGADKKQDESDGAGKKPRRLP